MFKSKCMCGKTDRLFKYQLGVPFRDECCVEAGYDHKGKLAEKKPMDVKAVEAKPEPKVKKSKKKEKAPQKLEVQLKGK